MEDELDHPLRPLCERLGRLEVEPADQVDEEERQEEGERHGSCARELPVEALDPVYREPDHEQERDDVREGHRSRDLPLELRERDGEDRREEEPLDDAGRARQRRAVGRGRPRSRPRHGTAGAHDQVREAAGWSALRLRDGRVSGSTCLQPSAAARLDLELGLESRAARLGARLEALLVRLDARVQHFPARAAVADDLGIDIADASNLLQQASASARCVASPEDEVEPASVVLRQRPDTVIADGKRAPSAPPRADSRATGRRRSPPRRG